MGVNYGGSRHELRGCVNDAENLAEFFVESGAAREADVTLLREPTGNEIIAALWTLSEESRGGAFDSMFVSFSGHGVQVRDSDGNESDGCDECICPSDFVEHGVITDDDLARIFARFSRNVRVRVLMDCCHSGSGLDLPHVFLGHNHSRPVSGCRAGPHRDIAMISGCRDRETSADAFDASRSECTGALTSAVLDAVKTEPQLSRDAFALVAAARVLLRERRMTQVPQLTASFPANGCDVSFMPMPASDLRG